LFFDHLQALKVRDSLCIVMFAERQANILLAKPNVTGKKLKRESPVYHNTELQISCVFAFFTL
jgi:hypothetical protein